MVYKKGGILKYFGMTIWKRQDHEKEIISFLTTIFKEKF